MSIFSKKSPKFGFGKLNIDFRTGVIYYVLNTMTPSVIHGFHGSAGEQIRTLKGAFSLQNGNLIGE